MYYVKNSILATDAMIDDDLAVNTTTDAGPGTEPATSLLPAGDVESSSLSSSAAMYE